MAYSGVEASWASNLPQGVGWLILDKLCEPIERIPFRGVCKWWRTIAESYEELRGRNRYKVLPMLMIPMKKDRKKRALYGIVAKKMYDFRLRVPYNCRCIGSSYGWMAFINEIRCKRFKHRDELAITLLNPFNGNTIHLPPLELLKGERVTPAQKSASKAILSADPSLYPDDYAVVVIYGGFERLAFLKSGQKTWTKLDEKLTLNSDAIVYRKRCYAVSDYCRIVSFNIASDEKPEDIIITSRKFLEESRPKVYLVESSKGELLLVRRDHADQDDYLEQITNHFQVYKLVLHEKTGRIIRKVEIKSLERDALFLGDNHSMSVPALDFPGCRPNSIYFTDDYVALTSKKVYKDVGIYDIESGSFGQHYEWKNWNRHSPPVVWILPPV